MSHNYDHAAFPILHVGMYAYGLSKREYFACRFIAPQINIGYTPKEAAARAVAFADALLAELSKGANT
jgi:hypothetical protein